MRRIFLLLLLAATAFALLAIALGVPLMARDTVSAQGPYTRYVATDGIDALPGEPPWVNDCRDDNRPCQTIQHAIEEALAGDVISIAEGTYGVGTCWPGQPCPLETAKSLTIIGAGADKTFIDGAHLTRVVVVFTVPGSPGPTVHISHVTIQNGLNTSAVPGGCITVGSFESLTPASLTLSDSMVRGCTAGFGGGIGNEKSLTIDNSTITNNSALEGGGIWNRGTLALDSTTVAANTAGAGGGIFSPWGTLTLTDSTVEGNTAGADGGGIYQDLGVLTANDSMVRDNSAASDGGGIWISTPAMSTIANTEVSGNAAGGKGGGIWGWMLTVSGSSIRNNTAHDGGGIASIVELSITRSTISGNDADGRGGGIWNHNSLTVVDSTLSGNVATAGGGVANEGSGVVWLTNSTVSGNEALVSGGGLANWIMAPRGLFVENATVTGNRAASQGGGVWTAATVWGSANSTFSNSVLGGNTLVGFEPEGPDCWGPLESHGYNLIQEASGCTIGGDTTGNILGQDPLLGPLLDNGGPTLTHALLPGSPAIDAGNPSGCTDHLGNPLTADQRGVPRPQGAACDIGAYEFEGEVDTDADGVVDSLDNCPLVSNADQLDADADGAGDACDPDDDNDGVLDEADNCPLVANSGQLDTDGDGMGDACDADDDNDGVLDGEDACPDDPEDVDGFEDEDGCPEPDNDADGVPDSSDACPDDAEDADGFEDSDGCPDPDNDGDGIADNEDACPDDSEDYDGFEDGDGCPDPDNDGDGIPDASDACPNEPEDVDVFQDGDGCPEPCPGGDLNGDGKVDLRDLGLVARAFGSRPGDERWNPVADLNHNGRVDLNDLLTVLKSSFDRTCRPAA